MEYITTNLCLLPGTNLPQSQQHYTPERPPWPCFRSLQQARHELCKKPSSRMLMLPYGSACSVQTFVLPASSCLFTMSLPAAPFDNTLLHQIVRWFFHWDLIFQNNLLSETERTRSGHGWVITRENPRKFGVRRRREWVRSTDKWVEGGGLQFVAWRLPLHS